MPPAFDLLLGLRPEAGSAAAFEYDRLERGKVGGRVRVLALGGLGVCEGDRDAAADWRVELAERIAATGRTVELLAERGPERGAARALLRVLRDTPGLAPTLIVAVSGSHDADPARESDDNGFTDLLAPEIGRIVLASGFAETINLGVPDGADAAERWCRHHRQAATVAAEAHAHHVAVLASARSDAAWARFVSRVRAIRAAEPDDPFHLIDLADVDLGDASDEKGLAVALAHAIAAELPQLPLLGSSGREIGAGEFERARARRHARRTGRPRLLLSRSRAGPVRSGLATVLSGTGLFASVEERSFGASSAIGLAALFADVDFSRYDLLVLDHAAFDEVFVQRRQVSAEAIIDRLNETIDRAARAGCPTVCVVSPLLNRFRADPPLRRHVRDVLRSVGVPVFDLYDLVGRAAAATGRPVDDWFADPFGLTQDAEKAWGRALARRSVDLLASGAGRLVETDIAVRPAETISVERFARIEPPAGIEAEARPREDGHAVMRLPSGTRLTVAAPAGAVILGVLFDPSSSGAGLVDMTGEVAFEIRTPAKEETDDAVRGLACLPMSPRTLSAEGELVLTVGPAPDGCVPALRLSGLVMAAGVPTRSAAVIAFPEIATSLDVDVDITAAVGPSTEAKAIPPADRVTAAVPAGPASEAPVGASTGLSPPTASLWRRLKKRIFEAREATSVPPPPRAAIAAVAPGRVVEGTPASRVQSVGVFDPLLVQINLRAGHTNFEHGFKIWPGPTETARARYRIMITGNSTSMWPAYPWSRFVGERLRREGRSVAVWNGAGKGHSSAQELLRVVRDAPGIHPDLILSLSGICDIGHLVTARGRPFQHKYGRVLLDLVAAAGIDAASAPEIEDRGSPAQIWLRNQRLLHLLARRAGIDHVTFLQPVMGFGAFDPSPEEQEMFRRKAGVILSNCDMSYGDAVRSFYEEVRARLASEPDRHGHVIDIVDVFAGATDVYKDHRHPTEKGSRILADKVFEVVRRSFDLPAFDAEEVCEGPEEIAGAPTPTENEDTYDD